MWLRRLCCLLVLGSFAFSPGSSLAASPFPAGWVGHWKGSCDLIPKTARQSRFATELIVRPKTATVMDWILIYGSGPKRQTRNYELHPEDPAKGRYLIDEKNGIILDAVWFSPTLVSSFVVGKTHLVARYERAGKTMRITIDTFSTRPTRVNRVKGRTIPSYRLLRRQSCKLHL